MGEFRAGRNTRNALELEERRGWSSCTSIPSPSTAPSAARIASAAAAEGGPQTIGHILSAQKMASSS